MGFPHRFVCVTPEFLHTSVSTVGRHLGGRGISGTFTVNWFEQEAVPTRFADISWRTMLGGAPKTRRVC